MRYQNSDSESERSFEREREDMYKKYEDSDYSGGDDSEFEDEENEDVEDLDFKNDELVENEKEKKKANKKFLSKNEEKSKKEASSISTLQPSHCELYVDNLPFNKNDIEIKNFFAKLNKNIVFVKLLRDDKGKSKGRAFVKYMTYSDALSIINEGEISMDKRKLRISMVDKDKKNGNDKRENFEHKKKINESLNNYIENKKTPVKSHIEKSKNIDLSLNSDNNLDDSKNFKKTKSDFINNNSNTIFVKNLPENAEELKLKKIFKKFGKVKNVRLIRKTDGTVKNFGYIDFEDDNAVNEATKIGKFNLDGNDLIIEKAKTSFNQNVFNESKTLTKKRKREQIEKERRKQDQSS